MEKLLAVGGDDLFLRQVHLEETISKWKQANPTGQVLKSGPEQAHLALAPSLFSSTKLVMIQVDADEVARVLALPRAEGTFLVLEMQAGTLKRADVKAIEAAGGSTVSFSLPRTFTQAAQRVSQVAEVYQVTLDTAGKRLLGKYASSDPSRVDSALRACHLLGLDRPSPSSLAKLLGTATEDVFAYQLVNQLREEQAGAAVRTALAAGTDAVAAANLLAKHFMVASALGEPKGQAWAKQVGMSEWAVGQAMESWRKWGQAGCQVRWQLSVEGILSARKAGRVGLALTTARLAEAAG